MIYVVLEELSVLVVANIWAFANLWAYAMMPIYGLLAALTLNCYSLDFEMTAPQQ